MRNSVIEKIPPSERRGLRVPEACAYSGIGRTQLYELMGDGSIEYTTVGNRRIVMRESLDRQLAKPPKPIKFPSKMQGAE